MEDYVTSRLVSGAAKRITNGPFGAEDLESLDADWTLLVNDVSLLKTYT